MRASELFGRIRTLLRTSSCIFWQRVCSQFYYATDTWTIKKEDERFLDFEMRCYRNLLVIRWHQKVTNDSIRQQEKKQKTIINTIRHKKKLTQFGHICRMLDNRLLKSVLFGSMVGVRCRGRQPKRWLDNITEWTGLSRGDAVKITQDRNVWRSFVQGSHSFTGKNPGLFQDPHEKFSRTFSEPANVLI